MLLGSCQKADTPTARDSATDPRRDDGGQQAPSPTCVEGLLTADNHSRCLAEAYLKYASNPVEFNKRRLSAQSLYDLGEKDFAAARYGKAFNDYSTSNAWVPSYKALVKTGDAVFHMHASGQGPDANGCSKEFLRAAELHLPQTYDAALLFHDFETEHTGLKVTKEELDGVRGKSTCLKELASKYSHEPDACVARKLIRVCLKPVGS
jgi:hypothetical protein